MCDVPQILTIEIPDVALNLPAVVTFAEVENVLPSEFLSARETGQCSHSNSKVSADMYLGKIGHNVT